MLVLATSRLIGVRVARHLHATLILPRRRHTGGGKSAGVSHVLRFHFRFRFRILINLFIFDQTRQVTRLEYEGAGASGGDADEQGKLGREDRKTGTGGGKGAEVSRGICFRFQYRIFFRFQYRISLNLFIFHRTLQAARGVGVT